MSSRTSSGPLVIGAGLMRTGTTSQKRALEILLGGECYHMVVIMTKRRSHLKLWYKAATDGLTKELADEIFGGRYRSCTDYPVAHFYQELAEIYPNAKFVLSVRDQKRWVASVRETIEQVWNGARMMLGPVRWLLGVHYFVPAMDTIFRSRLGFRFDMSDEEMVRAFDLHTEAVIRAIPKERLLVFRVTDGWGPLCEFLGVPVPDVPFPNVNDAAEMKKRATIMKVAAVVLNVALVAALGASCWFVGRFCQNNWA